MKFSLINIFFKSLFIICIFSCKKDPDVEILSDPCLGETEVTADFKIYEANGGDVLGEGLKVESDTVMTLNRIVLVAELENAISYTWSVNGNIYTGKKITYTANDTSTVDTITLIVVKTPSNCFPNDDGIDTLTKYVVNVPWEQWPFEGEYLGNLLHETVQDTFRINIDVIPSTTTPGTWDNLYITGLDANGCVLNMGQFNGILFYKYLHYSVSWIPCNSLYGYAIQNNGLSSLKFNYQSTPIQSETTDITFNGVKQ